MDVLVRGTCLYSFLKHKVFFFQYFLDWSDVKGNQSVRLIKTGSLCMSKIQFFTHTVKKKYGSHSHTAIPTIVTSPAGAMCVWTDPGYSLAHHHDDEIKEKEVRRSVTFTSPWFHFPQNEIDVFECATQSQRAPGFPLGSVARKHPVQDLKLLIFTLKLKLSL